MFLALGLENCSTIYRQIQEADNRRKCLKWKPSKFTNSHINEGLCPSFQENETLILSYVKGSTLVQKFSLEAWFLYRCNDHKHCHEYVPNSVPSNFDTPEHFDYNIANFTSIV